MQLVDLTGKPLGIVGRDQALLIAHDLGVDAVEVNTQTNPPVVKLVDWGKYQYQLKKRKKTEQKNLEQKEIRLSFKIDDHDMQTRLKRAKEFASKGHALRITLKLKGRERAFSSNAQQILERFCQDLGLTWDQAPSRLGNQIFGTIRPSTVPKISTKKI